ncbi:MAG: hypothetical protein A3F53_01165 [Candidatus Zambryskibacteria bacterium RIFCSPHIGHO2_12_FULL_48_10]|nr:MAG: hypothetical protein A3F53_01165 [Candidatus Zambryskibacteria bacterium RIFCSPHIGHO2_12_FULL_48_10]
MKMNYLPRNRARSPFMKPVLVLLGVFVVVVFLLFLFDGAIISIASPLWKGENIVATKLGVIGNFFHSKNFLATENATLKERIAFLELEKAARFPEMGSGGAMEEMFARRVETGGIIATVLARPPQTPYDTFIIDAGSNDGVKEGSGVLMSEGPGLGTVEQVFGSSAKVRLYSASEVKTAAMLERHGISVTLEGAGGGNFKLVLPRETEVEAGDRILSADISSRLLAVVGDVVMKPTDSFKEVLAISPVNIFGIHFVLIKP